MSVIDVSIYCNLETIRADLQSDVILASWESSPDDRTVSIIAALEEAALAVTGEANAPPPPNERYRVVVC